MTICPTTFNSSFFTWWSSIHDILFYWKWVAEFLSILNIVHYMIPRERPNSKTKSFEYFDSKFDDRFFVTWDCPLTASQIYLIDLLDSIFFRNLVHIGGKLSLQLITLMSSMYTDKNNLSINLRISMSNLFFFYPLSWKSYLFQFSFIK